MRVKYDSYDSIKTCPVCCGTGMENYSLDHKCYTCNGTGVVEKNEKDKQST